MLYFSFSKQIFTFSLMPSKQGPAESMITLHTDGFIDITGEIETE